LGNKKRVISANKIYTIGYEGAELQDLIATLKLASISLLIDIREFPSSRKKGFSKNALSQSLEENEICYVHLRGLGDPKEGRIAARSGDYKSFKKIFLAHMKTETAQSDLEIATKLVISESSCLLCYERDFEMCHRNIVASHISRLTGHDIRHIGVCAGASKEKFQSNDLIAAYA